jgi:tRNA nucleotidyltransferase (CCA-adding enzyme)
VLAERGVLLATTEGNLARGTLAMKLGGRRVEITTFRAGDTTMPLAERIAADLGERDMTIGALAFELASQRAHDPFDGLGHWHQRRIVPVGDAATRVCEHPVRWLRYYRKAHQLGFAIDHRIRGITLSPTLLQQLPPEVLGAELRGIVAGCESPGRCLLDLHEASLLEAIAPELALQFDGRPAGPQHWHPEVSQALHLILALEWATAHTKHLSDRDRLAVLVAVLCHDLGKGYTHAEHLPSHPGHERDGVPHVERLLDRLPGLADPRTRLLASHVCALHVEIRMFDELRPGTLAQLYETWFRARDYPVELFALAVAADSAGRLGSEGRGTEIRQRVTDDLHWLREVCGAVDAGSLRARFPDDVDAFRAALHQEHARAITRERPRHRERSAR